MAVLSWWTILEAYLCHETGGGLEQHLRTEHVLRIAATMNHLLDARMAARAGRAAMRLLPAAASRPAVAGFAPSPVGSSASLSTSASATCTRIQVTSPR